MKRALFFAVGLLFALSPVQVDAQLGPYGVQEDFEFLYTQSGGSTGPYIADWRTGPIGGPNIAIYCVDYFNAIRGGDIWTADVSAMSSGDWSRTRLGMAGIAETSTRYIAAAYLASLMEGTSSTSAWSTYHRAIWETTRPDAYTAGSDYWVGQALGVAAAVEAGTYSGSFNVNEWAVLTDVRSTGLTGGVQEYVTRVSVPEPATVLLMLTGLVMLVGVNRKRLLAIQDL